MVTLVAASTTVGTVVAVGALVCAIVAGALLVKGRKDKGDKEG